MLQSIPVMDENNNYQLYVGMHPEDHVVPNTSSWEQNLSFPSLIPVTMQLCQANNQWSSLEVATQASGNSKLCLMMFWKIAVLQPELILH